MAQPTMVTVDNFVRAETARYFVEQLERAAINEYAHSRVPVNVETQTIVRPNVDMLTSFAVVDASERAVIALARSTEYQVAQIVDENHYIVGVAYPGDSVVVTVADLSSGGHIYVVGRTALDGGIDRAHRLQDLRTIDAASARPFASDDYDLDSLVEVRSRLEANAADIDFGRAFGRPGELDTYQHALGAAIGWGGLSEEHAQYFQAPATSSGHDVWTFDVPPLDFGNGGYFSVIKYDENGWLDVERPGRTNRELRRNEDGTISVHFGDSRCADRPNHIETAEGQTFYYGLRLYRPLDIEETRRYIERLREERLEPA